VIFPQQNEKNMKVAISAHGNTPDSKMDMRFGRTKGYCIFTDSADNMEWVSNEENANLDHGAGIQASQLVASTGAEAIISGHLGPKAEQTLKAAGLKAYQGKEDMTVKEAYNALVAGELKALF